MKAACCRLASAACCRLASSDCSRTCFWRWCGANDVPLCSCCGESCALGHSHTTCNNLTLRDIHRRLLLPPTLAEVIDRSKTNRLRGGGQGVLLRRLRETAIRRVSRSLCSRQGPPSGRGPRTNDAPNLAVDDEGVLAACPPHERCP
jgi:hypothetical protein